MPETAKFNCPTCETTYKVVRTEASPFLNERQLLCLSCGAPLQNREGKYALKYFRTDGKAPEVRNGRKPKLI
jgi:transcription elongation factor Elf1